MSEIVGGRKLKGEIIPQGAKNEALQVICATLMTPEKVTIGNIPDIRDVNKLIELIQTMGVSVVKNSPDEYTFEAANIDMNYLKTADFRKKAASLRGSVMIVGPLLARFKKAYIPQPGGDKIGRRRLDTHFTGLQNLGATFEADPEHNVFKVSGKELKGTYMLLDEASVTGTAN
ncbi:MAG: UDP-N-acetylglucosamine 1-carboxyvinyltransferase, partial [Bacteroidetes bacterium]|nr:UDP-N-acetylglucosamine 1-carboxyvinyltransferase [Bacteroidota bacterium]